MVTIFSPRDHPLIREVLNVAPHLWKVRSEAQVLLLAVCIFALLGAMIVSAVLTWCVRGLARKKRWMRGPESARHIHSRPIPRLGGVAVYLTFLTTIVVETILVNYGLHLHRAASTQLLLRMLMPATLLFVVGLADDAFSLSAIVKLLAQISAGFWLFQIGCRVPMGAVEFLGHDYSGILSCLATMTWVVMLCNAFNLIDGLDGLAAGASVFPLLTFAAVALFHHNGQMGVAALILIGSLLGFLRFNFNPASIFLGDCGSLFLGFMLSALSLAGSQAKGTTLLSVALPIVACGFPIAETCVSVARRFLSGRPIFSPDREHFHHRLLNLGFTHRQVVILLFGASGICSLLSVMLLFPKVEALVVVGISIGLLLIVGVDRLGYPEFEELGRLLLRVCEQKSVIAQNVKIRHLANAVHNSRSWEEVAHALRSNLNSSEFSLVDLNVYIRELGEDGLVYQRKIVMGARSTAAGWSITLEFEGGSQAGCVELFAEYAQESLMLDVNLLFQLLAPALSKACQHISEKDKRVMLHPWPVEVGRSASVGQD